MFLSPDVYSSSLYLDSNFSLPLFVLLSLFPLFDLVIYSPIPPFVDRIPPIPPGVGQAQARPKINWGKAKDNLGPGLGSAHTGGNRGNKILFIKKSVFLRNNKKHGGRAQGLVVCFQPKSMIFQRVDFGDGKKPEGTPTRSTLLGSTICVPKQTQEAFISKICLPPKVEEFDANFQPGRQFFMARS